MTNLLSYGDGGRMLYLVTGRQVPDVGYRWHRPLPLVLAWIIGVGHPKWIPYGFLILSITGCGLLSYAVAECLDDRWYLAPLVVLFPGSLATLHWLGPEMLGVGLGVLGWRRKNGWLLAAAGLSRETLLLFAIQRRKILPFITYGVWFATSSLIWSASTGEGLENFRLFGLFHTPDIGLLILTIAMGVIALWDMETRLPAFLFLLLAMSLGPAAANGRDFVRYLMPLWVLGFIALVRLPDSRLPKEAGHIRSRLSPGHETSSG